MFIFYLLCDSIMFIFSYLYYVYYMLYYIFIFYILAMFIILHIRFICFIYLDQKPEPNPTYME